MDATRLQSIVGVVLALSIASERLVEIIKGFVPWLNTPHKVAASEATRCAVIQILAVGSGILTAFLASGYIPKEVADPSNLLSIIGLGLLASGGSGLWNSVLTYLLKLKDVKKAEAIRALKQAHQP